MKRLYIYMVLASILVVASCEKPTGEASKASVENTKTTGGDTPAPKQWHVSTIAGSGGGGYKDAKGDDAQFDSPSDMAVSGNTLYVADMLNHRIRKIDIESKKVTTFAGSTEGYKDAAGIVAQFDNPSDIAVSGNTLYVADMLNHRIRKIDISSKEVQTIAGGGSKNVDGDYDGTYLDAKGNLARFNSPSGIAVSSDGNTLYVADSWNDRIRGIEKSGLVTTLAGKGNGHGDARGEAALFNIPYDVAVSTDGNTLYVADTSNHCIREIDISSKEVQTIAGSVSAGYKNAKGKAAQFNEPGGIAVSGNTLYVADTRNNRIRKIDLESKEVTTIAGSGTKGYKNAKGEAAQFNFPGGIAVSSDGNTLYVTDNNHRIRKIEFR